MNFQVPTIPKTFPSPTAYTCIMQKHGKCQGHDMEKPWIFLEFIIQCRMKEIIAENKRIKIFIR